MTFQIFLQQKIHLTPHSITQELIYPSKILPLNLTLNLNLNLTLNLTLNFNSHGYGKNP